MQNPSRHDHQRSLPLLLHASGEQPFSLLHTNEPGEPSHPRPFRPSHHPPAADPDGLKPISPSDGQQCPNPSRCRLRLRPAPSASSPMQANRSVASSSRTQHAALRSAFIQSIARASSHRLPFSPNSSSSHMHLRPATSSMHHAVVSTISLFLSKNPSSPSSIRPCQRHPSTSHHAHHVGHFPCHHRPRAGRAPPAMIQPADLHTHQQINGPDSDLGSSSPM